MTPPGTESLRGKSVLVAGGLGTVGSSLAHKLVDTGADVLLVDCLVPEYGGNRFNISGIEDKVQVELVDIRNGDVMRHLVSGREYLFNLAGLGCHADSMRDPLTDLEMNNRGHLCLLETCRQHQPEIKVVYASTRQIYGKPESQPVDEHHPAAPVDINGINKHAAEQFHLLYYKAYGLKTCSLRMTNTLGPRMRIKDSRQVFYGSWFRCVLEGRSFEVWGGSQIRDINYIDDVVDAFVTAAVNDDANGRVFNIGSGEAVSLRDFADLIVDVNGGGEYTITPFPADRKRIDIGDYVADISLIHRTIGWAPRVSLREATARTLDYFRANLGEYV